MGMMLDLNLPEPLMKESARRTRWQSAELRQCKNGQSFQGNFQWQQENCPPVSRPSDLLCMKCTKNLLMKCICMRVTLLWLGKKIFCENISYEFRNLTKKISRAKKKKKKKKKKK